jgi:hypothetical protein
MQTYRNDPGRATGRHLRLRSVRRRALPTDKRRRTLHRQLGRSAADWKALKTRSQWVKIASK